MQSLVGDIVAVAEAVAKLGAVVPCAGVVIRAF